MEHGPRGAGRGFGGLTRIFEGEHGLNGWNRWGWIFGGTRTPAGLGFFKRNLPGGRQARIERVKRMGTDFWRDLPGGRWARIGLFGIAINCFCKILIS